MYGIDLSEPLPESERDSLIDSIARAIVDRRLEAPAVFLIESHKPLSFVASQAAAVAMPILGPLLGTRRMADLSRLLGDRENVDLLLARIEDIASEQEADT